MPHGHDLISFMHHRDGLFYVSAAAARLEKFDSDIDTCAGSTFLLINLMRLQVDAHTEFLVQPQDSRETSINTFIHWQS